MRCDKLHFAYSSPSQLTPALLGLFVPLTLALPRKFTPEELAEHAKDDYASSPATNDGLDTIYSAEPHAQPTAGAYAFSAFAVLLGVLIIAGYVYGPKYWKRRKLASSAETGLGLQVEAKTEIPEIPAQSTSAMAALRALRLKFMASQPCPTSTSRLHSCTSLHSCQCHACGLKRSKSRLTVSSTGSSPAESTSDPGLARARDSLQPGVFVPRPRQDRENAHREASIVAAPDSPISPQQHEIELSRSPPMASYVLPEPEVNTSTRFPRFSSFTVSIARLLDMPGLIDYSRSVSIMSLMKSDLTSNTRMTNDFVKPPDPEEENAPQSGAGPSGSRSSRTWLSEDDWLRDESTAPGPSVRIEPMTGNAEAHPSEGS
ncbi:hypothetical protein CERSUDRAFT_95486 [Gelatoporia subvermispora B]|uniref:Uncharacterized protein n=1 Tax=Ceriporiopsis subvermispora (strain B) TaxID=914234 RepID=M2REG6_CERS8|nr:hypothetical protein CERSUDRAFT_95486 [Gelatoporia subvermispora B]